MSHFVTIQTQIRDAAALRDACAELGLPLLENAEARGFAGASRCGDLVIRLAGPYDIALNRQSAGAAATADNAAPEARAASTAPSAAAAANAEAPYELTADWWGGHVAAEVGENYGRLLQMYGVHKASREARLRGRRVRRSQYADGTIKLTIAA